MSSIDEVKSRIDIVELASEAGVKLHRSGRIYVCLAVGILLTACGQFTLGPLSTISPSPTVAEIAAIRTAAAATAYVQLTKIAAGATPTATVKSGLISRPTQLPLLELTKIPGLLGAALSIETLEPFNGHNLRRVTGWNYGFNGFEWMRTSHLRTSAIIGPKGSEGGFPPPSYPAAIDLNFGKAWIPKSASLSWSERLQKIIVAREDMVEIYNLDGKLEKAYPGSLLGISPSRTKMLFKDGTWFDLVSGKTVHFDWDQKYIDEYYPRPVWSESENRVYVCCHLYGDAKTGDSYIGRDEGRGRAGMYGLSNGVWILNDRYLMQGCCDNMLWGGPPTFFDVSTKTFHYLSELANIPMNTMDNEEANQCISWFISPNGKNVWLSCSDGGYLVDLTTFKSQAYFGYSITDIYWSADGKFAWVNADLYLKDIPIQILSVDSKELKPVPDKHNCDWWHPTDNILACLSNKGQTLSLLDARTMSTQKEIALPTAFREIVWSPKGEHIALLAQDGSLWQIDYPTLENLEQLTPAMAGSTPVQPRGTKPRVNEVAWSPDGASLAFIGGLDIYIVDTKSNP